MKGIVFCIRYKISVDNTFPLFLDGIIGSISQKFKSTTG